MQYFKPSEFGKWYDSMSPRLLTMLDIFRHHIDQPVKISAAEGSTGRRLGMSNRSRHNVDQWGECQAVDIFIDGVETKEDACQVAKIAKQIGFTGIGVYPQWRNNNGKIQVGFHLDVRPSVKMGFPQTWGEINKKFTSIEEALDFLKSEES